MIPLYLSIEGMYSYRDKQEIDFQKLTSAGLFGIFGTVGSGKSTIIEAIVFALFGKLERLNSNKRNYNLMNLQSSKMEIEFHCVAKDQKTYVFKVVSRRNSKKFDDVKSAERMVYLLENGVKTPLEHSDGEQILGISYENFKRTVIIPQGMFREFLELKSTDRTEMMKQLFQLDAYDLSEKTKILKSETETKKSNLEGALQVFVNYTTETITEKNDFWQQSKSRLALKKAAFDSIEKQFQQVEAFHKIQEEIQIKSQLLGTVLEKHPYFLDLASNLKKYKTVKSEFEFLLHQYLQFKATYSTLVTKKDELYLRINENEQKVKYFNDLFQKNELDFQQLGQKRLLLSDFELGLEILVHRTTGDKLKERIKIGESKIKTFDEILNQNESDKKQLELAIHHIQSQKLNSDLLRNLNDWWREEDVLDAQIQSVEKQMMNDEQVLLDSNAKFEQYGFTIQNWQNECNHQFVNIEKSIQDIQYKENEYLVHEKMTNFVQDLEEGHACPLCGSLAHPNPANTHIDVAVFEEIKTHKALLLQQKLELNHKKEELLKLQSFIDFNSENLKKELEKLDTLRVEKDKHRKCFNFEGFSPENRSFFQEKYELNFELEKQLEQKRELLAQCNKEIEKNRTEKAKCDELYVKINHEIHGTEALIRTMFSKLKLLAEQEILNYNQAQIQVRIQEIQEQIHTIEVNRDLYRKNVSEAEKNLAVSEAEKNQIVFQLTDIEAKLKLNEANLQGKLLEFGFQHLSEVQQILDQNLDVVSIEQQILEHHTTKSALESQVADLQNKLTAFEFTSAQAQQIVLDFKTLKTEFDAAKLDENRCEMEYQEYKTKFEEKQIFEKQLSEVTLRGQNLHELALLFQGKGFVQYISTQYLMDLCEVANQRFFKLTRQSLSLKIDAQNEFIVVDHNHYDKERSVRTLSGGQFFQASLSLALALAESTRALNQNEKSFFFIDEGFGTQDDESMEQIFETLTSLQQENRIVGIISHVESLKERIPIALEIHQESERGSRVDFILN